MSKGGNIGKPRANQMCKSVFIMLNIFARVTTDSCLCFHVAKANRETTTACKTETNLLWGSTSFFSDFENRKKKILIMLL